MNCEIVSCILNGDGGSWIKDPYEPETIFQLERFHIRQEIKRKLNRDVEAMKAVEELFQIERLDEMVEYIQIYADSVKEGVYESIVIKNKNRKMHFGKTDR